jgi:hypothetical protein
MVTNLTVPLDQIGPSATAFRKVGPRRALPGIRLALASAPKSDSRILHDTAPGARFQDAGGQSAGTAGLWPKGVAFDIIA